MLRLALILVSFASVARSAELEAFVRVVPDRLISPEVKQIAVVRAGGAQTADPNYAPLAKQTDLKRPIAVEPGTKVDLWLIPKVGDPLKIATGLKVEARKTAEVKLGDTFGILVVRGDDLPRLGRIVATSESDPGPDEKGHRRVQFAEDYKTEMILPVGTYRIWIVPHNGARATRLDETVRILAGRTATVD